MDNQIYLLQPGGQRTPVKSQVFKHGGGIYLSLENQQTGTHVALLGSVDALASELERLAGLVRQAAAVNDQGHISRAALANPTRNGDAPAPARKPAVTDLNGDPAHDWPLYVARFHSSAARDVLVAIAEHYKKRYGYRPPDVDIVLDAGERVGLDFVTIQPYLVDILEADGGLKRGARARVAEALGVKDAGNYRSRVDAMLGFIQANLDDLLELAYPTWVKPNVNSNAGSVELLGNPTAKSNESNTLSGRRAAGE